MGATAFSLVPFPGKGMFVGKENSMKSLKPVDNQKALVNPDMGWTMHYYSNVLTNYGSRLEPSDTLDDFPGLSTVYLRVPWSFIELEEDRGWWEVTVEDEENQPIGEDLLAFILANLKPWYEHQLIVATHHAEIKAQAFGDGVRTDRLVFLSRYETHLDRKFQRTLAMLIKLKELRMVQSVS